MVEVVRVNRFGNVIVRAALQRFHRRVNRGKCRDDDDGDALVDLLNALQQFDTIHARHLDVHEQDVPCSCLKFLERRAGAFSRLHTKTVFAEPFRQRFSYDQFVINDEYTYVRVFHLTAPFAYAIMIQQAHRLTSHVVCAGA